MRNGNYELVVAPPSYPGKKYRNRYCYEHRLVIWQNTGVVSDSLVVHHKNGNKRDNRIENLELLSSAEHNRIHKLGTGILVHGTLNAYSHYKCRCQSCKDKWNEHNSAYKRMYRMKNKMI